MASFCEIAAHPVDHMLVIFRFGFEGRIWVLIASVPDLCTLLTFTILLRTRFHDLSLSLSLSDYIQSDIIEACNSTSRYIHKRKCFATFYILFFFNMVHMVISYVTAQCVMIYVDGV